jgi:hypothetical protein
MNPYDTANHRRLEVVEPPREWRKAPSFGGGLPEGEHIVYESTLEAQYRASAPTVPRLPKLEVVK